MLVISVSISRLLYVVGDMNIGTAVRWEGIGNYGKEIQAYIHAVQQDTQNSLMAEFYSSHMLARHVSDLIGPSSGAFFYKLYMQI